MSFASGETALHPLRRRLLQLKRRALRARVWWGLTGVERGIVELSVRCRVKFVNLTLLRVLVKILARFSHLLESAFLKRVESVGRPIAERLSRLAYAWGNESALKWGDEAAYVRCLGLNAVGGWRSAPG